VIAAGVVLAAAGGAWFVRNQSGSAQASASGVPVTSAAMVQAPTQTPAPSSNGLPANPVANPPAVSAPVSSTVYPAATSSNGGANKSGNASVSNAVVKTSQPAVVSAPPPVQVQPQPKKPALGEVRLAAPTLNRNGRPQSGNETEPGLSLSNSEPAPSDALGSGLENHSKGPAAPAEPLPVGGDVRPAKLLSQVSPIYPSLAKSQHVAGDVRVDALIDATGKVTTMKVVSGPTLLHQAAMDALRQWKYQPATLDGKTVPMHLTVTLQFRLQ
jgi:TonB family protein